jgi:hypothetical protein
MTAQEKLKQLREARKDVVDEFRLWERTHNRENYGRYDAFSAGYTIAANEWTKILDYAAMLSDGLYRSCACGWNSNIKKRYGPLCTACEALAKADRILLGEGEEK